MALYIALALCAFLFALLVYRYDLYEREPWYMLVLATALGYVAMRAAGFLELLALRYVETHVAMAAVAALVEELSRFVMVVAIAVIFRRQFNDPMDGIVYGSMIGLGMAVEESFYFLGILQTTPGPLVFPVEIVRLLGHLVMAGILGFGVGLARADVPGWRGKLLRCALVAFAIHFLWDFVALDSSAEGISGLQTFASIAIMSFGVLYYGSLVVFGSRLSKKTFAPDSKSELWGWPFTVLFSRGEK
ncbi:MAG: PrsW family intramembrane metalloprotease [Acidobacteria bacterium]|nr:MAG: PrsW family intramembrane metalloprotease [Acidobacteriota bacterium]